jgi:hypothetical protein
MANQRSKRTPKKTPKRRNVPSSSTTTDEHERDKDFLSEAEVETLRKEARAGRYGERDDWRFGVNFCRSSSTDHDSSTLRSCQSRNEACTRPLYPRKLPNADRQERAKCSPTSYLTPTSAGRQSLVASYRLAHTVGMAATAKIRNETA